MITQWKTASERKRYFRLNYHQRRRKQLELCAKLNNKEVKCFECGKEDNLELDHKNKEDKLFHINNRMLNIEELKKCQILCSECHKNKTSLEMISNVHGSPRMSKRCKCVICKVAKFMHNKRYKQNYKSKKLI